VKRGLQHHGRSNFSRDNQINTRFEGSRQDHQVMVGVSTQVGNFVSMVISGEWWRIKKRYLDLLLK
jgi:hypothetical protein